MGRISREDIGVESGAQLRRLTGLAPIHSSNGHQHVHALPFAAPAVAFACRTNGIRKLRLMVDWDHFPSAALGRLGAGLYKREWPDLEWEPTGYLWPTGGRAVAEVRRKLARTGALPLLIHPSVSDDFAGLEFSDTLRSARVGEFRILKELLR